MAAENPTCWRCKFSAFLWTGGSGDEQEQGEDRVVVGQPHDAQHVESPENVQGKQSFGSVHFEMIDEMNIRFIPIFVKSILRI